MIDTFRADRVGRSPSLTPHIDLLAAEGIVFERAITPIGTTLPALATALTGLHPREHGLQWNGGSLRPQFTTLAEVFRRDGYATGAFVSFFDVVYGGGMGQGFDERIEVRGRPTANLGATEVNRQALAWLREPRSRPAFAFIHYYDAHSPYRMTPYARERLPGLTGIYADGASTEEFYRYNESQPRDPATLAILRTLYDGEVVAVDRAVGEIVDAVDGRDTGRPTVVVLTADHGQLLGEQDRVGHGHALWAEILDVPLIVRDSRRPGGRRVTTRVGLVDLFPTLLELAGLEATEPVSGRSLVPALDGRELPERHYFAETRAPPPPPLQSAVLYGDRKVHKFAEQLSAYHLARDRGERSRASLAERDRDLVARLHRFDARQGAAGGEDAVRDALDEGRNARLAALGYAVAPEAEPRAALSLEEAVAIVRSYGALLERGGRTQGMVADASRLPHPKARVREALLLVWELATDPQEREFMRNAALTLAYYQQGVGEGERSLDSTGPGQRPWRGIVEEEIRSTLMRLELRDG